jgi:aspartate ammonia-lyase
MKKYRIEKDFLGEKQIPDDIYYGINTIRGYENFNINGDKTDGGLIRAVALVKKACAMANLECGSLNKDIAGAVIAACDKITEGGFDDQFIVNPLQGGGGTSLNMTANEVIANIALEILGCEKGAYDIINPLDHVNMSQSTNDVLPTAVNLTLIIKSKRLFLVLTALEKTLREKSEEMREALKMGRTHLNAASPVSFGQCFDVCASVLRRDHERIRAAAGALLNIPLGGTVIGTGLNTTPEYRGLVIKYLRRVSEIDFEACLNLADGIQNTDQYAALSSALKLCMLNLSKMASDLRLSGSDPQHGFGELALPPRQLGSSIISEKVNPVMAELINNISFMVCGYDLSVNMASQAGQLELNVYKPIISYCLFRSVDMMTEAIDLFDKFCLKNLKLKLKSKEEI